MTFGFSCPVESMRNVGGRGFTPSSEYDINLSRFINLECTFSRQEVTTLSHPDRINVLCDKIQVQC